MERCHFDECKRKINIMKFECRFCHQTFCVNHQLPERHTCDIKKSDAFDDYKKNTLEYVAITDKEKLRIDSNRQHRNVEW